MKRTQVTELLSNIKATGVSFFSILMFVALGVGLFLGISWAGPALQAAADRVFDEGSFHDLAVSYPYGLTDDDLARLAQVEGVSDVEAARSSFQVMQDKDGKRLTAKAQSLTTRIDVPLDVEGTLPAAAGEVALERTWAQAHGYAVGDVIALQHDADGQDATDQGASSEAADADGMKYLAADAYRVTALLSSPAYLSTATESYGLSNIGSGAIDCLLFLAPASFDSVAYRDGYTDVLVRCDGLRGLSTFSAPYKQGAAEVEQRVTELGDTLANTRFDALHAQAQQKVDEGQAQLDSLGQQLTEGQAALEQGQAEIVTVQEQLAAGRAQLESAIGLLWSGEATYQDSLAQLEELRQQVLQGDGALAAYDQKVQDVRSQLDGAIAFERDLAAKRDAGTITQDEYDQQLDAYCATATDQINAQAAAMGQGALLQPGQLSHTTFAQGVAAVQSGLANAENNIVNIYGEEMTVGQARERLQEAYAQLDYADYQAAAARWQLDSSWSEYYAGIAQADSAQAQVDQGLVEIEQRTQQLEQGKQAHAEGTEQLEAAKEQVESLQQYAWTVLQRQYNGGLQALASSYNLTDNLRFTMAALFVVVGLLVCYSAVSRIVHEQMVQIGTKRALGLRGREITGSFLAYSALAVVAGAIIGTLVGVFVVENIIIYVMSSHYIFGMCPPFFSLPQFLLVSCIEGALILAATWFACRSVLKKNAIQLLQGAQPPSAKPHFFENWAVWSKMGLFTQTIVNNCLNDGRRVAGTVIGVAGCTALIVTAITLNDNVLASFDKQYQDIYGFNAIAYVDTSQDNALDAVQAALADHGCDTTPVLRSTYGLALPDGSKGTATITVPQDDAQFQQLFNVGQATMAQAQAGQAPSLDGEGVWMSAAYAEHFGAKAGDQVTINESNGKQHCFTINGFFEYHLAGTQIVMGREAYRASFGAEAASNALLADTNGTEVTALADTLGDTDGLTALVDDKANSRKMFDEFSKLSMTVVGIYLALSTLMAIVVLLNLNVMCIEEKKRELIVLMINGFSVRDAKRYIYRDTIVLTVLGIIAGVALGALMGYLTVLSGESSSTSYVKDVDAIACLAGVAVSAVLAAAMSLVALRRIPQFNLTDINRF